MTDQQDLAARLRQALKQANISPSALGATVGVDKSVVSRWLAGRVRPTQHNRARIAAAIAERLPGFSILDLEGMAAGRQQQGPPAGVSDGHSLPVPFSLLDSARKETARRGMEYFGIYTLYYWSFGQPGRFARMALMLRPQNGLIEVRYGAEGFAFEGWALLMLNRMYVVMSEERFEAMAFLVLNAGQQPKARFITGVLTGPAEGMLIPTSGAAVLMRKRDLSDDPDADLAEFAQMSRHPAIIDDDEVPAAARAVLRQATVLKGPLLQVPFASGDPEAGR